VWRLPPGSATTTAAAPSAGRNSHPIIEGIFEATARALRMAVEADPRMTGVPSTKGVL